MTDKITQSSPRTLRFYRGLMRLVPNPRGQRLAHEPRLARAGDELERLDRAGLLRRLKRRGEDAQRLVRVRVRVKVRVRVRARE